jgi:serine/threonine-protein kinase
VPNVGRFVIERELGRGGMGVVYAAYDPELGRSVAIKLVRPPSAERKDPSHLRARMLREAQSMAQVTHPNVVAIHDVGTFGEQVFIAMEYAEGRTLTQWLSAERRTWRDIVAMFVQCGKGLAAAHARNLVHRDFKPDNVWVGDDGRARVLDFGLARATTGMTEQQPAAAGSPSPRSPRVPMLSARVTKSGTFLGTPPYMAPEQLKGEPGDARSDQFSFCVALYHALYGELPFEGETAAALLEQMERRGIREPPRAGRIPSWLRRILRRGLSLDPADRYPTMDTLLGQLTPSRAASARLFLALGALMVCAAAVVPAVERTRGSDAPRITSLAVLPLKNLSGDPQQDYFADGTTEALINELGNIGALRVLSYHSAAAYRGTAKPLSRIAQELNAQAFLEGGVMQSGERVRITVRLVEALPEHQLWAESYEFDLRDVVAMQREVARDVASRIRVKVTEGERERLTRSAWVNSEAYQSYLLGRAYLARTPTSSTHWARAREYFEKAIEKDPGYAPAYAGLAELYMRNRGSVTKDPRDARTEARRWAEKALRLDDSVAEAHNALGRMAQQEWDWATAEREYRRAIELNPTDPLPRVNYLMFLYAMLRSEEAVAEAERAQRLDPVSPLVNTWAGAAYFFAGRTEEAMASWEKALELDPAFPDASLVLARARVTEGKYGEAIAVLRKAATFHERNTLILGALAHAYARAGVRDEAMKLVSDLKRIESEERGYVSPFGLIWAHAALGEKDQAFAILEKSYEERRDRMVWLSVDPLLDPLRSDPRFGDLVRRVGLPSPPPAAQRPD